MGNASCETAKRTFSFFSSETPTCFFINARAYTNEPEYSVGARHQIISRKLASLKFCIK